MPEKNNKISNNHTARLGDIFNKEIEEIKKERKEKGLDKTQRSTRQLTNLIIKHDLWKKIKKDMIIHKLEGIIE